MKRLLTATVLFLSLALPSVVGAQTNTQILSDADREDLNALTAKAFAEQGVCYSWKVTQEGVGFPLIDEGGQLTNPNAPGTACRKSIRYAATYTYTSEYSESEDYVTMNDTFSVGVPGIDLSGIVTNKMLLDDPELAIFNAVNAMPAKLAETGAVPWMTVEVNTEPLPAGVGTTNTPGDDWTRSNGGLIGLCIFGIIAAVLWAVYAIYRDRNPVRPSSGPYEQYLHQRQSGDQ